MRRHLRLGSGLCWAVAWALAVAGPVVYLAWPGDLTWWAGAVLALPLFALAVWRAEHKGAADEHPVPDSGAPAPPLDHPGGF